MCVCVRARARARAQEQASVIAVDIFVVIVVVESSQAMTEFTKYKTSLVTKALTENNEHGAVVNLCKLLLPTHTENMADKDTNDVKAETHSRQNVLTFRRFSH